MSAKRKTSETVVSETTGQQTLSGKPYRCAYSALDEIAQRLGREYGFDRTEAEFTEFRDLKIQWTRSYGWIELKVSDYLKDAPDSVLESILRHLFGRISGNDTEYSDDAVEWLTSDQFRKRNRNWYIKRSRGFSRTAKGGSKDLTDAYRRLIDSGLVDEDDVYLTWTKDLSWKAAHTAVLMKTVAVNDVLDSDEVEDDVLDFVLYHHLNLMGNGFDPTGANKGKVQEKDLLFDGRERAMDRLNGLGLTL